MTTRSDREAAVWPPQALDPAGPFASPLAEISWVMLGMGVAVLAIVLLVLTFALNGTARSWIGSHKLVVIGGFAFPVVVLTAALVYGLATTARLNDPPGANELRIRVVGEMWWWRVLYLDGDRVAFETANEIRIPTGRPITFELESADVIHSFWAPQLGAKLDMIPGRRNVLRLQADRAETYRGYCTEFCGAAHALMAFEIVAVSDAEFERWRSAQMAPTETDAASRGAILFDTAGCAACHNVSGAVASGHAGPDLTHFASRRTLGAGILPNDPPTLRRWIADANALKPGVRMPSYETLSVGDRESIALYLESLR